MITELYFDYLDQYNVIDFGISVTNGHLTNMQLLLNDHIYHVIMNVNSFKEFKNKMCQTLLKYYFSSLYIIV